MKLNIADIEVGTRKRKLDDKKVQSIADSFTSIGQLQPVTVAGGRHNNPYLIAGLHRLEAAKRLGWETIDANIFDGDDIECELAEIDENLMRNDLTVLEQGEHLARRQELVGFKRGDNRFTTGRGETVSPLKTTPEIAKEIGLTERSAQHRMQVARNITPEVKDAIRDTEIANSTTQLLELARLAPEKQMEVAQSIANGAKNVSDAKQEVRHKETLAEREKIASAGASVPQSDKWNVWQADINTWVAPRKYDFIITDPPYPKEYLPLWEVLAKRTKEWLKPGGLLIAMSGQSYLNEIYAMMDKHLIYYWTSCFLTPDRRVLLHNKQVMCHWKPLLIYALEDNYSGKMFDDTYTSPRIPRDNHEWEQSEEGMSAIIKQVCLPGQYILDPFSGSGTTLIAGLRHGCIVDGIDIDINNVNISKSRLSAAMEMDSE